MINFSWQDIVFAFSLTLFAGLTTSLGSLLTFFTSSKNNKFLSISLGFSAGIMIYLSFVEILPEARNTLQDVYSNNLGDLYIALSFFGGMLLIALINKYISSVPYFLNKKAQQDDSEHNQLIRTGMLSAVAIAIHNFPEGIATFISALDNPTLGISIALAVAIHNIPEGIAVSVPIYYATKDRKQAFLYGLLSGLAEPLGAIFGFLFLMPFLTPTVLGIIYAIIAGIMVYISFDELLPTANDYGNQNIVTAGLIVGMIVMAISLILLP